MKHLNLACKELKDGTTVRKAGIERSIRTEINRNKIYWAEKSQTQIAQIYPW